MELDRFSRSAPVFFFFLIITIIIIFFFFFFSCFCSSCGTSWIEMNR